MATATGAAGPAVVAALTQVGRTVVERGLVVGSGGNLPGADRIVVTGAGTWLDRLRPDAFARVRVADGASLRGTVRPSTELALHLAVYRARPDVTAVVHLHPQTSVLLTMLGEPIRLITTDHAAYLRRIEVVPFHPPGTQELADAVGQAVADGTNCVVLPQHGCAVVADTVEMALRRAMNLEEAAVLTYRALLLTGGLGRRPILDCPIEFAEDAAV
jgi:ribulose-5-phosphate 4-epimerase/fuculose-1-phosphate aldolase